MDSQKARIQTGHLEKRREIIHEVIRDFEYPVAFGFPVSHGQENYALKIGVQYELNVGSGKVTLEEC